MSTDEWATVAMRDWRELEDRISNSIREFNRDHPALYVYGIDVQRPATIGGGDAFPYVVIDVRVRRP